MIKSDRIISSLMHADIIEQFAKEKNISVTEARISISKMSFGDYYNLLEAPVMPPSGNMIGPNIGPSTGAPQQNKQAATNPQQSKPVWSGQGPLEVGMEVGIKGQNGLPTPSQISKVDQSARGVQVKNPVTGKIEWMNMDALQPGIAKTGAPGTPNGTQPAVEAGGLSRLRELAGLPAKVGEDCSAGASGAGGIAVAAKPMGTMQRRQPTAERVKKEYTAKRATTVVGDTKPAQASGELSATLAANNKPTASRTNAGFKK
jgi:hypothetical protein